MFNADSGGRFSTRHPFRNHLDVVGLQGEFDLLNVA